MTPNPTDKNLTRREALEGIAAGAATTLAACSSVETLLCPASHTGTSGPFDYDLVIIGSGFGGTMTALTVAHKLMPADLRTERDVLEGLLRADPTAAQQGTKDQEQKYMALAKVYKDNGKLPRILILERGTWWTTPVPTVQDPLIVTPKFLTDRGQPVQYWSSAENEKGLRDILERCVRGPFNKRGLYEVNMFPDSHVSVLHASGVGGGSLVYSNITMRPPPFVLAAWNGVDWGGKLDFYFELARHAIGYGIVDAWMETELHNIPYTQPPKVSPKAVNRGLSNISARSARLNPQWKLDPPDGPSNPRRRKRHDETLPAKPDYWIDRARIFQDAVGRLMRQPPYVASSDGKYGTVDSAINDLTTEPNPDPLIPSNYNPTPPAGQPIAAINHCERQGRCNVGCLPGARHTLNKQLITAAYGKATDPHPLPLFPNIEIRALTEVDRITALDETGSTAGYSVCVRRLGGNASTEESDVQAITSKRVIVASGCLGTNELMLRCRQHHSLPGLDKLPKLGFGFSTNGDFIAFAETTKPVNLSRGPMQTSYAHFNDKQNNERFHIVEDLGLPRALSTAAGIGVDLAVAIAKGHDAFSFIKALIKNIELLLKPDLRSEDEKTMFMMAITASGRDQANGQFSLVGNKLHVHRADGLPFYKDPIYEPIRDTLKDLARELGTSSQFVNPFVEQGKILATTHPLGGCRIASDRSEGVVNQVGEVFNGSHAQADAVLPGLHIADAAIIPTALGVNPSLTISALALRIGDHIASQMAAERV